MARNRRQSESVTFAVGRGCFLFLVGVVCVGFSVTKIIVGSEYVSKCPSREMIPVYIIVSGCLPVLLSALRQPYDGGHEMDKDKWSMKVTLFTAVIGVMVNLAWLVAGTYLVVTVWKGNICSPSPLITPETSPSPSNVTSLVSNGTLSIQNKNIWKNSNNSQYHFEVDAKESAVDKNLNETEKRIMNVTKSAAHTADPEPLAQTFKTTVDIAKTTTDPFVEAETVINANGTLDTKPKDNEDNVIVNGVSKPENNSKTSDMSRTIGAENIHNTSKFTEMSFMKGKDITKDKENSDIAKAPSVDKHCITCDIHILRFSLAVIVIDWLFVIGGTAYFCNFVYHRFSSITSQILLING
ncbi:uncharacterized protein LOC132748607 [Ruditapes philippinarum]|uniref:uncharacterized protein LOC132748607 n=1 Tax=Ruditapes philippinarum TaxID=129788 RepID=UPI00295C251B|nr:uncharacterized protein LOC132748607 [Ruditapes philippinarum]